MSVNPNEIQQLAQQDKASWDTAYADQQSTAAQERQHEADREAAIEALVAARKANAADLPASLKAENDRNPGGPSRAAGVSATN